MQWRVAEAALFACLVQKSLANDCCSMCWVSFYMQAELSSRQTRQGQHEPGNELCRVLTGHVTIAPLGAWREGCSHTSVKPGCNRLPELSASVKNMYSQQRQTFQLGSPRTRRKSQNGDHLCDMCATFVSVRAQRT